MSDPLGWHTRGYLPHYDDGRSIQSITYRLADALPAEVLLKLEEQLLEDDKRREAVERYLDAGHGSCLLREPRNAEAVCSTWRCMDGVQYLLHAWMVMSNHVHVVAEPLAGQALGKIVGAWKSVTARRIFCGSTSALARISNEATGGGRAPKRRLWQVDYYDRYIRNAEHYAAAIEYIHQNPVKAGLVERAVDWPWSSAATWERERPRSLFP